MDDIAKLSKSIDKRFDDLTSLMGQFADDVNGRFDNVNDRFDKIDLQLERHESRLNSMEQQIVALKTSHNQLINTIDGFVGRIDGYETELAARDHKIDRLERWIEQIAAKTGVKLTQ